MKHRFTAFSTALLAVAALTGSALSQDTMPAHPRYARLTPHLTNDNATPATPLTTWNGSFTYKSKTYNYNMVGTAPANPGKSTTIRTFIIPVALKFVVNGKTTIFSPETKQSNGVTAVQSTIDSPIFQKMDWVSPQGTNLGTTQYEDAFQRGNFWQSIGSGYHTLLGQPTVLPVQTITVPAADGSIITEFGLSVGSANIDWFDAQLQSLLSKFSKEITPTTFPIFITYNSYLTEDGCCIGGYHNSEGSNAAPQAYAMFTYIGESGVFAQDVSALSHEAGEWMDDPLVVNIGGNPVECGDLEVGDPEEGYNEDGAVYGAFPYTLNGFTYHLQDLVYLEYFGAPTTTSVDGGAETFLDNPFKMGICTNGG